MEMSEYQKYLFMQSRVLNAETGLSQFQRFLLDLFSNACIDYILKCIPCHELEYQSYTIRNGYIISKFLFLNEHALSEIFSRKNIKSSGRTWLLDYYNDFKKFSVILLNLRLLIGGFYGILNLNSRSFGHLKENRHTYKFGL